MLSGASELISPFDVSKGEKWYDGLVNQFLEAALDEITPRLIEEERDKDVAKILFAPPAELDKKLFDIEKLSQIEVKISNKKQEVRYTKYKRRSKK